MSRNPSEQYRMLLNTIELAGYATFDVKAEQTPPTNRPTWVATVRVTGVAPVLSGSIYIGTFYNGRASSRSAANDAACCAFLVFYFDTPSNISRTNTRITQLL
ncbi:hypothetical protein FRC01_013114 [Tulasnella sp. 417]|nr:hypothetical protein FRC01_013114 [Tulasnella sp. 417]